MDGEAAAAYQLRVQLRMSQRAFAQALAVHTTSVQAWEHGKNGLSPVMRDRVAALRAAMEGSITEPTLEVWVGEHQRRGAEAVGYTGLQRLFTLEEKRKRLAWGSIEPEGWVTVRHAGMPPDVPPAQYPSLQAFREAYVFPPGASRVKLCFRE